MRYVGVDLHKRSISVCVVELVGREREIRSHGSEGGEADLNRPTLPLSRFSSLIRNSS